MTTTPRAHVARATIAAAMLIALAAACGGAPPTAEPDPPAGAAAQGEAATDTGGGGSEGGGDGSASADAPDAQARLEEINAELDGLDAEARRGRLIELAQEEGGEISFYGSTNIDDIAPVLDAFEEATGVTVSHYRAGGDTILSRVLEEAEAGFLGADVVQANISEMPVLEAEGQLLPLETPIREQILEAGRFDTWLSMSMNAFIAAWNTDRVPEPPTTWQEVLAHDGVLSMDIRDFDWFATLVQRHFMEDLGMSEDEAVQLFLDAGRNTVFINGHSIGSQMLVAGEFDMNLTMYHHHSTRFPEGAPYAWRPAVEPIVISPSGLGIVSSTTRPATSLLFVEFILTDGQPILAESGRTVANTSVDAGLPPEYETVAIDVATLGEEREKWEGLFEEVVLQSGEPVIE